MSNSNSQTAHIWAQQVKESAKSSNGNLSFEGTVLYSYTTPIARFVPGAKGKRVTLITSRSYSVTTSGKHMPAANRAVDYGRGEFSPCFHVPNLGSTGFYHSRAAELTPADHAENLAYLAGRYSELVSKALRVRADYHGVPGSLAEYAETAIAYAKTFKLKAPKFAPEKDAAEIAQKRADRDARNATPAAIAKRAKAAEYRAAAEERKATLARLKGAEKLAEWRKGAAVYLGYGESTDAMGGALLRVRGENLETSMGAVVPLAHAIRVFQFAKLCRDNSNGADRETIAWQKNGRTLRVGHFQVDHVKGDGSFRAGCHLINWQEIELVALAAGVANMAPADTREYNA